MKSRSRETAASAPLRVFPAHHMIRSMDYEPSDLSGKLLIAMPGMGDPRFEHSVVYMCAHSEEGAMGLIVNKPTPEVRFSDLLDQLNIAPSEGMRDIRVHFGGPVENGRGFVLHTSDYSSEGATLAVNERIGMTATMDVLEELAQGRGPSSSLFALGYSGWGPGQLESEIVQNGWLTCDARDDIIFGRANEHKWTAALRVLGIDPVMLSATGGSA